MKITINLTEEHIKLIKTLRFEKFDENRYGVDNYSFWGGTYLYEQMALILGYQDKVLPETIESPMGARYEEEVQKHLEELDSFFVEHIVDVEDILHQMCDVGLKVGKYSCLDNIRIWKYDGETKNDSK